MRDGSYPATGIASSTGTAGARRPPKRRDLFLILLVALYESRRRKIERVLLQYQYLIDRVEQRKAEQRKAPKAWQTRGSRQYRRVNVQVNEQVDEQVNDRFAASHLLKLAKGVLLRIMF
jgi:hypothetical protein